MRERTTRPEGKLDIGVYGARTIPSTYSGYETFLTTLLPELANRGHRVTMYCRSTDSTDFSSYAGVKRVRSAALPGKSFNTLSHGLLASFRARGAGHDVVLVVNVANAVFCAIHKFTGQPVLLNTDGQEWLRGKWGTLARRFFRLSACFAGTGATGLISDCQAMAAVYERDFGARSSVIPYCVPRIQRPTANSSLQRYGVEAHNYYITAGRLNPENNVDAVAVAYSRTELSQPLLVLGAANYDSPVVARLRGLSSHDERIRFVGHVDDRRDFLALIGSASGYIHGHSVGGMNPSLVEAMHSAALVVAFDTPYNRETVGDAGVYFSRSARGEFNLAEVLCKLRELPADEQVRLRRRAAARALDRYNAPHVVDAYEQLLQTAAGGPARRSVAIETRWTS